MAVVVYLPTNASEKCNGINPKCMYNQSDMLLKRVSVMNQSVTLGIVLFHRQLDVQNIQIILVLKCMYVGYSNCFLYA